MVVEAQPLGVEMATALARRGIETHLVDPHPWPMAEIADPDIMAPVEESWRELGVKVHLNTAIEALSGTGKVQAVQTLQGELMADMVVMGTKELPNASLARKARIKTGATGGIIVDLQMATSAPSVYAAGDCVEVPQGFTRIPVQGLSGSHAYAQGKVAGANAGGSSRAYQPVYVPWGLVGGNWMIGGVPFGETRASALGVPFVLGVAEGISRARYYPDLRKIRVKLLADPKTLQFIGAQLVGGEGIKERCDLLALGLVLQDRGAVHQQRAEGSHHVPELRGSLRSEGAEGDMSQSVAAGPGVMTPELHSVLADLQSLGVRVEREALTEARSGGAGPSDAGMMWVEGIPITFPHSSGFVSSSPFSIRKEEDGWGSTGSRSAWRR